MRRTRTRSLLATLLALLLILAACGDGDDAPEPEAEDDAPLALDLEEEDEAEEPEEEPAEEEPAAEFDLVAAIDDHVSTLPDGWGTVGDVEALKEALQVENTVLIDVREAGEYEEGHIEGAINIPIREVASSLELIPTDRPVIIYCASGWRAGMAYSTLRLMGYDNVRAWTPGWNGWTAAEEPVSTDPVEPEVVGAPDVEPELLDAVDGFLSTLPEGFLTNSLEAVQDLMGQDAVLVDVREPAEYEAGFIPDALSVPLRTMVSTDVEVPTSGPVVVYCQSGYRAALALPMYHLLGNTNAVGFPGSFGAWEAAGEVVDS
ncbi:MAG: rhodanese-like domain-containing protein [Nitriliruptoraceae bacterium]